MTGAFSVLHTWLAEHPRDICRPWLGSELQGCVFHALELEHVQERFLDVDGSEGRI